VLNQTAAMLLRPMQSGNSDAPFTLNPARQRRSIMKIKAQIHADGNETRKQPITYNDLVWVQCKGYRCLAYTDSKGQWINFYTGKELTDFVKVIG
jgi:hypothetical protein